MILRKCGKCGGVARTHSDLSFFVDNIKCKYGKENLCKVCKKLYLCDWRKIHSNILKHRDEERYKRSREAIIKRVSDRYYNRKYGELANTVKLIKEIKKELRNGEK